MYNDFTLLAGKVNGNDPKVPNQQYGYGCKNKYAKTYRHSCPTAVYKSTFSLCCINWINAIHLELTTYVRIFITS
jgi:hypothetical protein